MYQKKSSFHDKKKHQLVAKSKYFKMSVSNFEGSMENLFYFKPSQAGVETNSALIFEEIIGELESYFSRESNDKDSTDNIFDLLSSIFDSEQEEFDELVSGDSDKKRFLWALSRIFALLLNTKVNTAEKIKRILKIATETTLKIWQEPKPL